MDRGFGRVCANGFPVRQSLAVRPRIPGSPTSHPSHLGDRCFAPSSALGCIRPPWRGGAIRPVAVRTTLAAAVFDFDGTLFDATGAIVHSFNAALRRHARAELPADAILRKIGRPLYEMFPALVPDIGGDEVDGYIDAYREAFWPVCVSLTRPLPALDTTLAFLRNRGVHMAIATNRTARGARAILDGFGFSSDFETIIALEDVEQVKPHPEPVQRACAALGVEPRQTVMIGDTPDDIVSGRRAGARTVGVLTGVHSR
ncbi:MAG: HAD-IA family hydrolase, partial [Kiritimatiellae bacterium]|nr:HAD-IA family hydrolase [Kiritimatiellia bacterium]